MKIGPYKLTRELGAGGFGLVYLAQREWDRGTARKKVCVIKMPRPSKVIDPLDYEMFLREIDVAMLLEHDNIVRVFDSGIHEGTPYLAMNFVNGVSLAQLNRRVLAHRDNWEIPIIAHVARELLYALRYAHGFTLDGINQKIVHRDIKPANVLISGSGGVFLTDFGIASTVRHTSASLSIKGTLRYMAPEQFHGRATPMSDLFSVGALLWELVEGKKFRGDIAESQLYDAVSAGTVPTFTRRDVPDDIKDLICRLLHPEQSQRLQIDEALERLERYPPTRTKLEGMVMTYARTQAERTGHTEVEFKVPKELEQTLAYALAGRSAPADDDCIPITTPREVAGIHVAAPSHQPRQRAEPPDSAALDPHWWSDDQSQDSTDISGTLELDNVGLALAPPLPKSAPFHGLQSSTGTRRHELRPIAPPLSNEDEVPLESQGSDTQPSAVPCGQRRSRAVTAPDSKTARLETRRVLLIAALVAAALATTAFAVAKHADGNPSSEFRDTKR